MISLRDREGKRKLKFMYKCLLLDQVVDSRWIGHRLLDGFGALRLTKKGLKYFEPYVVAEL